jgi:hypothetical protein
MELVLGFVALGAGILLFVGANLVALVLMIGGSPSQPERRGHLMAAIGQRIRRRGCR